MSEVDEINERISVAIDEISIDKNIVKIAVPAWMISVHFVKKLMALEKSCASKYLNDIEELNNIELWQMKEAIEKRLIDVDDIELTKLYKGVVKAHEGNIFCLCDIIARRP